MRRCRWVPLLSWEVESGDREPPPPRPGLGGTGGAERGDGAGQGSSAPGPGRAGRGRCRCRCRGHAPREPAGSGTRQRGPGVAWGRWCRGCSSPRGCCSPLTPAALQVSGELGSRVGRVDGDRGLPLVGASRGSIPGGPGWDRDS